MPLQKVRIESPGYGRGAKLTVDDKVIPFTRLIFDSNMDEPDVIRIDSYIRNFEFTGDAQLMVNYILIGSDEERKLYEQLKVKYESGT